LPSPLLDGSIREERSPSQLRATPGRRFHDESRIASVRTSGRFSYSTTHTERLPSSFSDRRRFLQIFAAAPPTSSHVLLFVTVAVDTTPPTSRNGHWLLVSMMYQQELRSKKPQIRCPMERLPALMVSRQKSLKSAAHAFYHIWPTCLKLYGTKQPFHKTLKMPR